MRSRPSGIRASRVGVILAVGALALGLSGSPVPAEEAALFLPGGGEAKTIFAQMQRRRRARDWRIAADLAHRLISDHGNSVLPVPGQAGRWAAAPIVVGAVLSGWPAEGLEAYRSLVEPQAREQLAKGDAAGVADLFPVSAAAGVALQQLADAALESGQVGIAADLFDRVVARVRLAVADAWVRDPAPLLQRAAMAYAEAGLVGRLERLEASPLVAHGPPALATAVAAAIARARRQRRAVGPPRDWPTMGGNAARARAGGPSVGLDAPMAWAESGVDLPGMVMRRFNRLTFEVSSEKRGLRNLAPPQLQRRYRPVFPIVVNGIVYISTGMQVDAYELYTGRKVRDVFFNARPQWQPRDKFEPCLIHTLTHADGALYAQIGLPNTEIDRYSQFDIKEPIPQRRLVSLDARTGRVRWSVGGGLHSGRNNPLDERSIVAVPVVSGDTVYTVARGGRGGLGEFFLVALDVATGRLKWERLICGGGTELNMFGRPLRENVVSPLALHGGLIYVSTNIGAVVAVDARGGRIRWIARYDIVPIPYSQNFSPRKRAPVWETSPPIVAGDLVLVAPNDSPSLLALDRRTGVTRWTHAAEADDFETDYRYLLGVVGDLVVVSGNRVAALDLETGSPRWIAPDEPVDDGTDPPGQGVVAGDSIYWPTGRVLRRLDLDGRVIEARAWDEWGNQSAPGNVTCVGGALLVTSLAKQKTAITAIFRRADVLADLEAAARRAPKDPAPLVTATEVRLQADDDLSFARVTLKRARQRLTHMRPGAQRQALSARARHAQFRLGMAEARQSARQGRTGQALAALRSAFEAADDPTDRVRVLLQMANHHESVQNDRGTRETLRRVADELANVPFASGTSAEATPAGLVALRRLAEYLQAQPGRAADYVATLQEVLVRFPDTPLPRDGFHEAEGPATAGRWASDRIRLMLTRGGRAAYAKFDAEAKALVDNVRPVDAESVLHTLLTRYPHAEVLPKAVLALAESLRASGRAAAAADALRDWLRESPDANNAGEAGWLLARCYEEQKMFASARAVLERLRRTHGHARVRPTPGAAPRVLRELITERLSGKGYGETATGVAEPALGFPLQERFSEELPASATLLSPAGVLPKSAQALLFISHEGTLSARDGKTGAVRWRAEVGRNRIYRVVGGQKSLLVTSTRQVAAVDPSNGTVRWTRTVPAKSRPLYVGAARGLAVVTGTPPDTNAASLVMAVDEQTGQPLWKVSVPGRVLPPPMVRGDAVALFCSQLSGPTGQRVMTLRVLDLLSGDQRFELETGAASFSGTTAPSYLADGSLVVLIGEDELRALDPSTGETRWSRTVEAGAVHGRLLVASGQVIATRIPAVGSRRPVQFTALEAGTGTPNWTLELRHVNAGVLRLAGDDLLVSRRLDDGRVVLECYDARDGRTLRWRGDLGRGSSETSRLLVARDHVVAVVKAPAAGGGGRIDIHLIGFHRQTGKLMQDPVAPPAEFERVPYVVLSSAGTVALQPAGMLLGLGK